MKYLKYISIIAIGILVYWLTTKINIHVIAVIGGLMAILLSFMFLFVEELSDFDSEGTRKSYKNCTNCVHLDPFTHQDKILGYCTHKKRLNL
jgi:hypothetical protein